ncbi:MAG: hypothetical protein ACOCPX_07045 [Halapricum sp.]
MNPDVASLEPDTDSLEWVLIAAVGLLGLVSLVTGELLWGGFVLLIAFVAALPALVLGAWSATVPWPLLAVPAVAAFAWVGEFNRETAGYLAIVALALIIVIELESFTPIELSRRFAVVFCVMVTMALEGVWIIAQAASDRWLGTAFLTSQVELQWDIVLVTVVAIGVGVLYYGYATQFDQSRSITIPDDEGAR